MTTFRRRNVILSGSVLLVLALGISMLVVLTERARALAEMQAGFVLGVSHELRTPLTVIRLAADNLKKGIVETADQALKYGEIIHAHASDLSNMIEETLELARMQSAPPIHQRTITRPEQIVKNALTRNESALRNAGIEVDLDLAAGLPPINADVLLVQRCLENLIQNVVKYAAVGGWVAIRVRKAKRPEGEGVQISVEDRGPGISPADLPHIFEPFYRGKSGEASRIPGVGLGLTLVKRVVEAHQGSVKVESSKITRFSILLPSCPSQGANPV
jgi:signal transduction histidine kinase